MGSGRRRAHLPSRRSRLVVCLAFIMALSLTGEVALAARPHVPNSTAPSLGRVWSSFLGLFSPVAKAAGFVGSWLDSTLLSATTTKLAPQEPSSPGEVPWKRTATTRTIRNANGSYRLEASTVPIHYKDGDGLWHVIDNTLVTSSRPDYAWQNKANGFRVRLKDGPSEDMVSLDVDGDSFIMGPVGTDSPTGSKSSNKANYRAAFRATDLEYAATETGVKETLTLNSSAAPNVFKFRLVGSIGSIASQPDGSLLVRASDGSSVMRFDAPWAAEQQRGSTITPVTSSDRHVTISAAKVLGGFEITLTVNAEWLKTASFPVIVDPTITIQPDQSQARETYVRSDGVLAAPGTSLLVGTDTSIKTRSIVAFDTTAVQFHSIVSSATLTLTVNQCFFTCANAQTIEAHEFTASWNSWGPTWAYADANYGPTLDTDPKTAGQQSGTMNWASSSLTSVVQSWINTDKANNGFLLRAASETLGQGGPAYNSSRFGTASARPKLTVTYTVNATHGYPPAPPGAAATQVDLSNTSSSDVQYPMLAPAPGRSLFRASDGTLMSIDNEGNRRMMRASKPPYSSWSSAAELAANDGLLQGFMRTDDSGTLYTIGKDLVQGIQFKRWARSGSSTNWNNNRTTVAEQTVTLPVGPLSIARTTAGRIWIAYQKNLVGDTTPTLVLKSSDDDGATIGSQVNLVRAHAAQLVPVGSDAGIILHRFSDGKLTWRSSAAWATETVFAETLNAGDPFQAVSDDQGRVHLVYTSGGGIRYRMRDAAGTWTPAPGSTGTVIAASDSQPTLSTDGTKLTMLSKDAGGNIVRREWSGSWGATSVLVPPPASSLYSNVRASLPARTSQTGVLPYLWQDKDSPCICVHYEHFDYLDQGAPGGAMSYPGEGEVLVGTITADAAPVDEVGVQRVDFFVDRGGGLIGYLSTDSTPSDGFTYPWNTKEIDGSSKRLWPPGAYRLYAVAWDYKGNRGETNRPLSYVEDQDLGVRPYRPSLSVPIGAGLDAQVNLWNGNMTLSHALLSDPTVIGPMSITRTYNSQDTKNGTAGLGWSAGADLDADLSFTKLIDHSADAEYPQNVAELTESDGTPHWYQFTSGASYAPFIDDYSTLVKNSDGTWLLTMADGGRYTFNSSGDPIDYRTAEHTLDQASFAYTYTTGKLSSIVDPVGRGVTTTYDANGRLWKVTSNQASPARTWTFTYNTTSGVLTDVQDPVNGSFTTHFDYDASNRLTQVTTPAGVRTQFGYDTSTTPARVNEVRQLHTEGMTTATYVTSVAYVNPSTTTVTRPKGNIAPCSGNPTCKAKYTTTYGMDARYRLTTVQITLPDGSSKTKTIAWNTQNLQTSASDFSGNVSTSTFDLAGNMLTQTTPDPDGAGPQTASTVIHRYDEPYQGLQALYFNSTTLTPPAVLRRLDPQLNFSWAGSPGSGVNADNFSVRWIGYIDAPSLGAYVFYTTADNASRLYVDGRELIDNWTSPVQTERASSSLTLSAGLHPITVEMNDTTGTSAMTLAWQGPGISKQTVPSSKLKPGFNLETSSLDDLGNVTTNIFEDESPPDYTNDQDPFYGRLIEQVQTNTPAGGGSQTLRSTFAYNSYGQRTSKTMPKGNTGGSPDPNYTTTYTYYGTAESATDPCNPTSSYSQLGLLKRVSQPGLADKTQVHDGAGNVIGITEGKGTTCSGFDGLGRMTGMKASDRASATTYGFDRDGRQTSVNDPTLPAPSTYTFDDLGRLSTAKDALAVVGEQAVTYSYDEHGDMKTRIDKTGTYQYVVDELDRVTQITDQASRNYTFSYDADGKLLQQNLPNATRALLGYDNADRLTSYRNQTSAGSPLAEYAYTYNDRAEKLTEDGPQGLWAYRYDSLGRLEQAHDPTSGRTRRYVFDLNSNRTDVMLNTGWNTQKIANDYGSLVGLVLQPTWTGTDATFNYPLKFTFPFGGTNYTSARVSTNGFLTLAGNAGSAKTLDLFSTTFKTISPYNRDLKIVQTTPGRGIYVEEPVGNGFVRIRWQAETEDASSTPANFEVVLYPSGEIKFNYQNLTNTGTARVGVTPGNGLDFVAVPDYDRATVPANAQTVRLTAAGASTQASYSYNALDQLTAGTGLSGISYNSDGEQETMTGPAPRGSWTFGYDGRGLMRSATSGSNISSWALDGESRVVKQTKASESRYRFAGPGGSPAWEEDASGAVTINFIRGPGGLVASYVSGTPTFYMLNGHGDVIHTRDLAGGLVESFDYDENGNPRSVQTPARYGYAGRWQKQRDADTSLIRMGARMLDPLLGRFTSWDPIEGGALNSYDYAAQNPINNYDFDGGKCWSWIRGFCKAVKRAYYVWVDSNSRAARRAYKLMKQLYRAFAALGRAIWDAYQYADAFVNAVVFTAAAIFAMATGQWGAAIAATILALYFIAQFTQQQDDYQRRYGSRE